MKPMPSQVRQSQMPKPARKRLFVGPGLLFAILLSVGLWIAGKIYPASPPSQPGTSLDAIRRAHADRVAPPPLWKPEPAFLTQHAAQLALTGPQIKRITAEDRSWNITKARLSAELKAAALPMRGHTDAQAIQAGMAAYSELSRYYDAQRSEAWGRALTALRPADMKRLRALQPGTNGGKTK